MTATVLVRLAVHCAVLLVLLVPLPQLASAAVLEGWFRHSADGLWINRMESLQTAAAGPLADAQPPTGNPSILPPIYGEYVVDYGHIGVYANNDGSAALSTAGSLPFSNAGTSAGFSDQFTISSAGVPFFSQGTMRIRIDITGQLLASGYGSSAFGLDLFVGSSFGTQIFATRYGSAPEWGPISGQYIGDDFGSYLFMVPITFGAMSNLSMQGHADAGDFDTGPGGGGIADLATTFSWGGVVAVLDAEGALLEDFEMISQSGYDYATLKPALVPLPATAWMFVAGLVAFLTRLRRGASTPDRHR